MNRLVIVVIALIFACSPRSFKPKWLDEQAPDYFTATFETSKGSFSIESRREWSPEGVDRLYQLLNHDFYEDIAIFRVVPGYVAQFGINADTTQTSFWLQKPVEDEAVLKENARGTIAFARGGPRSRSTQIFINLVDNNPRLDTLEYQGVVGFPVVAEVIDGMDVVAKFNDEYGNEPAMHQDSIYRRGNTYLKKRYPGLDYIIKAYINKK